MTLHVTELLNDNLNRNNTILGHSLPFLNCGSRGIKTLCVILGRPCQDFMNSYHSYPLIKPSTKPAVRLPVSGIPMLDIVDAIFS